MVKQNVMKLLQLFTLLGDTPARTAASLPTPFMGRFCIAQFSIFSFRSQTDVCRQILKYCTVHPYCLKMCADMALLRRMKL